MNDFSIVSTLGISTFNEDQIVKLNKLGTSTFRINFAQRLELHEMEKRISNLCNVRKKHSLNYNLMIDLPYPHSKVRLGAFPKYSYDILDNQYFEIHTSEFSEDINKFIPVQFSDNQLKAISKNDILIVGDGNLAFKVLDKVNNTTLKVVAISNGQIACYKGVSCQQTSLLNTFSSTYIKSIVDLANKYKIEQIALSFIENETQISHFKNNFLTPFKDYHPKIISKIENQSGINNMVEIIANSDAVVVARGDLALYSDLYSLGITQRDIISKCINLNTPVYVATQVIESLMEQYLPSRSEITDLTNLISSGVSGIWLAKETSSNTNHHAIFSFLSQLYNTIKSERSCSNNLEEKNYCKLLTNR